MRDKIAFLLSVKLFRLLAINLAIGIAAALLMTGGLLRSTPTACARCCSPTLPAASSRC